jgi:hypothetical protein
MTKTMTRRRNGPALRRGVRHGLLAIGFLSFCTFCLDALSRAITAFYTFFFFSAEFGSKDAPFALRESAFPPLPPGFHRISECRSFPMKFEGVFFGLLGSLLSASLGCGSAGTTSGDHSAGGSTALVGTWTGELNADNGEKLPCTLRIAESGYPIYDYQTKSGARAVELTAQGQTVQFVPPEGGVATVTVEELSVSGDRIRFTTAVSVERTSSFGSSSILDQSRARVTFEIIQNGSELDVEMTADSQSVASQPGLMVPGEAQTVRCRGALRKG